MSSAFRFDLNTLGLLFWVGACLMLTALTGSVSSSLVEVWFVNVLPYFLLSLAAGVVISCGQIDISTGGVMSLAGMMIIAAFQYLGSNTGSAIAAHAIGTALVLLIYFIYSFVATRGVSTLIATLSLLLISKGLSTFIQSCLQGVGEICRASGFLSGGSAILPSWVVVAWIGHPAFSVASYILILIAFMYWRFRSRWGLEHIAVGMDVSASRFCRIPIGGIYTRAFIAAGGLVVLATLARLHGSARGGWSANVGWGDELLAIAIAVIGGTRISGGRLNPIGILLASFGVYLSRDIIINDLGVPAEVASLLFGGLLFMVVVFNMGRSKLAGGQRG